MKLKAFAVRNVPYERVEGIFVAPSAGLAIRDNSQFLARVSPNFKEDLKLYEIGEFNDDGTVFIAHTEMKFHSWDEWKHPETQASKLSLEEQSNLRQMPAFSENR